MKFTRNGSVQLIAGVIAGAGAIIVACGGDDSTGTSSTTDAGSTSSSGAASSSGTTTSSSGGSSSGTTSSSGGSSSGDAGNDAASDGGDGGAKKANGETCTNGIECQSGECFVGGNSSFCTVKCTMTSATDPVCEALGAMFSGKCNKKGFCEKL